MDKIPQLNILKHLTLKEKNTALIMIQIDHRTGNPEKFLEMINSQHLTSKQIKNS